MPRRIILTAVLAAVLAVGCSREQPAGSGDGTTATGRVLNVVATTTQVADFATNVGGDRVRVTSLFKPNVDAHDYEPSPADIDTIARADLVVENGAGLETWLHDTVASSGFDGPVVDTSQGVRLRQVGGEPDPHIWQNPRNAQLMAANIERAMAAADPADAGVFQANLAAYTKQLQALDAEVQRADRQPGQQEAGHQPRRLRLLHRPLRAPVRRLDHSQLRHLGRAVGPRHPRPGRQDQGDQGQGRLLRDLAAAQDRRDDRPRGRGQGRGGRGRAVRRLAGSGRLRR